MTIYAIFTPNAPTPGGHYSQAIVHNDLIYVAGQLPIDPATGNAISGDMTTQATLVLQNIQHILQAANSDLSHLLKVTVYVSNIEFWGEFNRVYAKMMGTHKPARAVVPTNDLHYGCLLEIEAIACVK
jgi:2-iminobutanoate/2-iminopropanoate deaminase